MEFNDLFLLMTQTISNKNSINSRWCWYDQLEVKELESVTNTNNDNESNTETIICKNSDMLDYDKQTEEDPIKNYDQFNVLLDEFIVNKWSWKQSTWRKRMPRK